MKTITIGLIGLLILGGALGFIYKTQLQNKIISTTSNTPTSNLTATNVLENASSEQMEDEVAVVADNLNIPWDIAFLPDKSLLVTERTGKLLKVDQQTKTISEINGVKHVGEGGLLGIALDPAFESNHFIYLYSTYQDQSGIQNRVERYKFENDTLLEKSNIISGIKGSSNHDGGRIEFGPDGKLYISTGDAEKPDSAQDKNSLNGKILRINPDGTIPSDNPFNNAVYSYGHRNIQGLAWDKAGLLWATEHGPSGLETGNDEVNLITKGANYGWPTVRGSQVADGLTPPKLESGKGVAWAPASLTYNNNALYFGGLRGVGLYKASIGANNTLELKTYFKQEFGRIRTVRNDPDGYLYITTSNTDGRGKASENDDKIIKIKLSVLE